MAQFQDEDDQYAALLAPTFDPRDEPAAQSPIGAVKPQPAMTGISRPPDGGNVRSIAPPAQPIAPSPAAAQPAAPTAIPAAASPTGNPSSGPSLRDQLKASLARQSQSVQGSEASTAQLQAQPDLGAQTAPLEAQRSQLAQPIDPNQAQYKPSLSTRIFRGIDAVRRGGVLGAFDPADVGGKAYGAPNRQYDVATQQQQQKLGAVDQQLSQSAAAYKASSDRIKDIATQQKADALGEKDLQGAINTSTKNDETYKSGLAKSGMKETDDGQGGTKVEVDPDSPVTKFKQAQEDYTQAKADYDKLRSDPNSFVSKQAAQKLALAGGNLQMRQKEYLKTAFGVDSGGAALPGANLLPDGTPVGTALNKNVAPTATQKDAAGRAQVGENIRTRILAALKDPQIRSQLGPILGRAKTAQEAIGNLPPGLAQFGNDLKSYAAFQAGMHPVRGIGGLQYFDKVMGGLGQTPEQLEGKLASGHNVAQDVIGIGRPPVAKGSAGQPGHREAPPAPAKSSSKFNWEDHPEVK